MFYGYLNPESTKTRNTGRWHYERFYGYLNPESTKTAPRTMQRVTSFTVT